MQGESSCTGATFTSTLSFATNLPSAALAASRASLGSSPLMAYETKRGVSGGKVVYMYETKRAAAYVVKHVASDGNEACMYETKRGASGGKEAYETKRIGISGGRPSCKRSVLAAHGCGSCSRVGGESLLGRWRRARKRVASGATLRGGSRAEAPKKIGDLVSLAF